MALSKQTAHLCRRQARTYHTPQGNRLNVSAIASRFRIQPDVFRRQQRKGWPCRNGQPLPAIWEKIPGSGGLEEATYLETEVIEAITSTIGKLAPGWRTTDTFEADGHTWLTVSGVVAKYDVPRKVVELSVTEPSRFLGRGIHFRREKPPKPCNRTKILVIREDDAKSIGEALRRPRTGEFIDDKGRLWLTADELAFRCQCSRGFCGYWSKKLSKQRSGEKALQSRKESAGGKSKGGPGGPGRVRFFLVEDAERILRCEESRYFNTGKRGIRGSELAAKLEEEAKKFLRSFLKERGPTHHRVIKEEAQRKGITDARLMRVKLSLGILSTSWTWRLPGQKHRNSNPAMSTVQSSAASVIPKSTTRPVDKDNSISMAALVPAATLAIGEDVKDFLLHDVTKAVSECVAEMLARQDHNFAQPVDTDARTAPKTWKLPWFHGGVLQLNGLELGKFRDNQRIVLQAIQDNEWKNSTLIARLDSAKVNDAIRQINKKIKKFFLRIYSDGSGGRHVNWEITQIPLPTA